MLKASVLGVFLAAGLLAPQAAYAYGRNAQPPSAFAEWREAGGAGGEAAPSFRPYRAARYGQRRYGTPHVAWRRASYYAWRRPTALRRYRVSSLRPVVGPPSSPSFAPASFGAGDVVAEAARWIGSGKFTGQSGPWCADAVSAWLERSGHRPLEGRMASSALAYGPRLERPEVGALAVLGSRRGWASHVGVVSGVDADGSIHLISGNWGRRVAEAVVSRGSVIAFVAVR